MIFGRIFLNSKIKYNLQAQLNIWKYEFMAGNFCKIVFVISNKNEVNAKLSPNSTGLKISVSLDFMISFTSLLLLIGEDVDIQKLRYPSRFSSTRLTISLQTRFLIAAHEYHRLCSPINDTTA